MTDIGYLMNRFIKEYKTIREELDYAIVCGTPPDPAKIMGMDCDISEKTKVVWRELNMSEEEIIEYGSQLNDVAMNVPPKPGCLSPHSILDFVERQLSPQDSKKYYTHLLKCNDCRDKVFKASWFFLD